MEKQTKKAYDLAQNEVEEKQIENLKNIIKNLLQKKYDKEKEKDEIEEEIKLIKQDIDDFKSGRLDKIKERHEVNPNANEIAPIRIVIINDHRRIQYPFKPFLWNYEAQWIYPSWSSSNGSGLTVSGGTSTTYATVTGTSGSNYATFTGGAYEVGNKIINL